MRNKLVITLIAITMVTVALPTAVTQVNPDWQDPDGWGADNYVTPEPNFGDSTEGTFDYDATKTWQEAPTLSVLDPDGDGEWADRVYFDLVVDTRGEGIPGYQDEANDLSPRTYMTTSYMGYLGFWRDCNGDSFIGDLETLRMQYPFDDTGEVKEVDTDLCPPPSSSTNDKDRFFNDGTQVKEFVPIGAGVRDIDQGDIDQVTCSDRNGGPSGQETNEGAASGTPRANGSSFLLQSATGDGGNNINCEGDRPDWIQDDYVKTWMQLLYPESPPKPTSTICVLCHDGTYRDTNGFFRWVDSNMLGAISSSAFGLWPSENQPGTSASAVSTEDPDPGQQCERHGDPVNEGSSAGPYDDQGNAITNAQAFVEGIDPSGDGPATILPGCSPIPNWAYIDMPVLGPVAYPGHLAEDRLNSSESQNTFGSGPGVLGEPFHYSPGSEDHCQLNEDPSSWEGEDDADPVGGWSASDPTHLKAYYSPEDNGPHVNPTWRSIQSAATWQVEHAAWEASGGATGSEPQCESDGGLLTLESHAPTGQAAGLKGPGSVNADSTLSTGSSFNPARDNGVGSNGGATDTSVCSRTTSDLSRGARCSAYFVYGNFIDVPNEAPLTRSVLRTDAASGFADVSFGDGNADPTKLTPGPHDDGLSTNRFDPAGDGNFSAGTQGVYDATNPPGYSDADAWTQTLIGTNPDDSLPGGNNAHTFGAEGCGPSDSGEVGFRGQPLALTELPSDPVVYDANNKQIVENPTIAEDDNNEPVYDLPESGEDDVDAPDQDPADPANSFWLCDRGLWMVEAGDKEVLEDPNDPSDTTEIPGCNLHVWSDNDGDGEIDADDAIGPKHERSCYLTVKVGDPYDLRDFECFDWDAGGDTYDTLRSLPTAVHEAAMGPEGNDEDLYFDCDTPGQGTPAP